MMLAVMYGMMPSANTDSCRSAPPENRFSRFRTLLVFAELMHFCTFAYDTPGLGTVAPSRYMATIASVNSSFLRRSGVLNALRKAESTGSSSCAERPSHDGGGRIQPVVRPHEMSNYLCGRTLAAGRRPAYPRSGVLPPSRRRYRQRSWRLNGSFDHPSGRHDHRCCGTSA